MLGQFHEISIQTQDIQASSSFYESLGFSHCVTSDAWPHPYGVLTDGRIFVGLHQYKFPSPSITFVRRGIREAVREFEAAGVELAFAKLSEDAFNEFGFRDPCGQMNTVLGARTYSPTDRRIQDVSMCGDFLAFSMPCGDFDAARPFWERLGYVALGEAAAPFPHLPLTGDAIELALHRPRWFGQPLLVFTASDMAKRVAALRDANIAFSDELPAGLDARRNALLLAPEGTTLLLLERAED